MATLRASPTRHCHTVQFSGILTDPLQSNLDYPDSLGLDEIVRIIEGPDNRKYEY